MSEDDKLRAEWQILYAENLDLTSNSDFYNVSQAPQVSQLTDWNISLIFEAEWTIFFCDDTWDLYREWVATPLLTTEEFVLKWENSTYIYLLAHDYDIWRIAKTNLSQTNWTTYLTEVDSTITTPSSTPNWFFEVTYEDTTYLWISNKVWEVNNSTWAASASNVFTIQWNIVWMSQLEDSIQIFTRDWKYYLRDKVPDSELRIKDLWVGIWLVKNIWSVNYVISSWTVYWLNWYQLEKIFWDVNSDLLLWSKFKINSINPNRISYAEWVFYLWVSGWTWAQNLSTPLNEFEFWDDWILTVWIKKQWFPMARNIYLTRVNNVPIVSIDFVYAYINPANSFGKVLYIWYQDNLWNTGIATVKIWDYYSSSTKNWTDWIILYNTFDAWLKEAQKSLHRIRIRANITDTDDAIYLCRVNSTWGLEWFNWTQATSKVSLWDLWDDWYLDFIPITDNWVNGDYQFYNLNIALILSNDSAAQELENWIRVYSLTYEYDVTRAK